MREWMLVYKVGGRVELGRFGSASRSKMDDQWESWYVCCFVERGIAICLGFPMLRGAEILVYEYTKFFLTYFKVVSANMIEAVVC